MKCIGLVWRVDYAYFDLTRLSLLTIILRVLSCLFFFFLFKSKHHIFIFIFIQKKNHRPFNTTQPFFIFFQNSVEETMPFCHVGKNAGDTVNNRNGNKIFYRTYGTGPIKVLMIIGLAGTHESWNPQIHGLVGTTTPNNDDDDDRSSGDDIYSDQNGIQVCAFDNRGMGRSSIPKSKSEYS